MTKTPQENDRTIDEARLQQAVRLLLAGIGEDPDREGLIDTPKRVVKALMEMTAGYRESAASHLAVQFKEEHEEIIALTAISFVSMCEHHLLPFNGTVGIAYIPNGALVGLSKLARVVDVYARRLQLQERLTDQIAQSFEEHVRPKGVAVVIEAQHSCLACRGVRKSGALMRTSSMRGVFRTDPAARAEVLSMLRSSSEF